MGLRRKEQHRAGGFVQQTFRIEEVEAFRWEKALAAADAMEDEEILRKLAFRK